MRTLVGKDIVLSKELLTQILETAFEEGHSGYGELKDGLIIKIMEMVKKPTSDETLIKELTNLNNG